MSGARRVSIMKYAYENLGEDQFEKLIVFLCHELLGVGFVLKLALGKRCHGLNRVRTISSRTSMMSVFITTEVE
jgi:hypothetical protein